MSDKCPPELQGANRRLFEQRCFPPNFVDTYKTIALGGEITQTYIKAQDMIDNGGVAAYYAKMSPAALKKEMDDHYQYNTKKELEARAGATTTK